MNTIESNPTSSEERLLNEDDLWDLIAQGRNVTLIKGKLVEMSPASRNHGKVAMKIGARITTFVEERKLGSCFAAETGFVVEQTPTTILAPDFAFIAKERDKEQKKGFGKVVPDFVLEVQSPSESLGDTNDKLLAWLNAGVKLVWIADMKTKSITAYQKQGDEIQAIVYTSDKVIDGGEVFNGFKCRVQDFFE
ncbi:MAG: Uma2 family endonuclease [Chlorobiales bacterium]